MPTIIAIGTSAGGQAALTRLLSALQPDFPAGLLICTHLSPGDPSYLASILSRVTPLAVESARDGETVVEGHVYVAVPDRHLMLAGDQIRLTRGPKENRSRPSIDVLFRSCAQSLGAQAIGVVLTGSLDDGTAGLWTLKDAGGQAIVQSPDDAEYPSMPVNALKHVVADRIGSLDQLSALLLEAAQIAKRRPKGGAMPKTLETEVQIAAGRDAILSGSLELGRSSVFSCPDCGGTLAQIDEGSLVRYRCHTGHAYSLETLGEAANDQIDEMLWRALRAIDERTLWKEQESQSARGLPPAERLEKLKNEIAFDRKRADIIRSLLVGSNEDVGATHAGVNRR